MTAGPPETDSPQCECGQRIPAPCPGYHAHNIGGGRIGLACGVLHYKRITCKTCPYCSQVDLTVTPCPGGAKC